MQKRAFYHVIEGMSGSGKVSGGGGEGVYTKAMMFELKGSLWLL